MDIVNFIKQYSFIFILLLFTFLFIGLKLLLITQDKTATGQESITSFTEKNIFYLILSIFIILIVIYLYNIIRFYKTKPIQKLKPSYEIHSVYDTNQPIVVFNQNLDCPQNESKFSFSLFLNIEDYYCNRGFWKCIFIKGNEINEEIKSCMDINDNNQQPQTLKFINNEFDLNTLVNNDLCFKESEALSDSDKEELTKIIKTINLDTNKPGITMKDLGINLNKEEDLDKRIELICNVLDNNSEDITEKKSKIN